MSIHAFGCYGMAWIKSVLAIKKYVYIYTLYIYLLTCDRTLRIFRSRRKQLCTWQELNKKTYCVFKINYGFIVCWHLWNCSVALLNKGWSKWSVKLENGSPSDLHHMFCCSLICMINRKSQDDTCNDFFSVQRTDEKCNI